MPTTIVLDFSQPNPGPVSLVLGDALLITGTPGATRAEAYIYKFTANGVDFEEFWVSGISMETGGAPDKLYTITDAILSASGGATRIEVTVEQRYRQIYQPPETDQVLEKRTVVVSVTDTDIRAIALEESEATQAIAQRFSTFVQQRSIPAIRLTADAPNGSSIARIDIYDGSDATGERVGGAIYTPGVARLTAAQIPESQPLARYGEIRRTVVITDARGRKVQRVFSSFSTRYVPPQIIRLKLRRAEADGTPSAAGTRVLASVQAEAQSIQVSAVEKNTAVLCFRARPIGGGDPDAMEATVYPPTLSTDQELLLPTAIRCDLDRNYAFELVFSDWFTSVTRNSLISTSGAMISLHRAGAGVAIGKKATDSGLFDVALPAKFGAGADFAAGARFFGDVLMQLPLPESSGGTGVRSLSELKTALNVGAVPTILRGTHSFTLAASASAASQTVNFETPFTQNPSVFLQLQLMTTFNVVTYAVSYINKNYFQFQVTNGNATQKNCVFHWVAVG